MLIGMLLDQQVTMEWAFGAPLAAEASGWAWDTSTRPRSPRWIPAALEAVFRDKPALHRYPGSMAKRTHDLCVVHRRATTTAAPRRSGTTSPTGDELLARVLALPGFGKDKARIFVGLLGKRLGVRPPGWERPRPTGRRSPTSTRYERVAEIREKKRAAKRQAKTRGPDSRESRTALEGRRSQPHERGEGRA